MTSPITTQNIESELDLRDAFKLYGEDHRYIASLSQWRIWNGQHWKKDETLLTFDRASGVCSDAAAAAYAPRTRQRLSSARTIDALEKLARYDQRLAATVDQWDNDPWLLNTPGGVVDLHTGALRPAKREDYATKITAVAPGGGSRRWLEFLSRITDGDVELQRFIQQMCGYALTGVTSEHALFFLYGTGGNGKSVLLNTIAGVMGSYAMTAAIDTFIASFNEHHPTEIARLQNARLVISIEPKEGGRWDEAKVKLLTGGDRIAARYMRQDYFEFTPQFKLLIAGNLKPGLSSVDEAIRRRFNLLPFTVTIPASERDKELTEKLRDEWGGILQWMIEGCLAWQSEGLQAPQAVSDATENYLEDEDVISQWIEDCCDRKDSPLTSVTEFFDDWRLWCENNGEEARTIKSFSTNLQNHGFEKTRTREARGFKGIGLK